MNANYEMILHDLRRLRMAPVKPDVFGAESHRFRVNPPLTDEEVRGFERNHQFVLPPDYRAFITLVGNGGAGPYYGVFKLGEMDNGNNDAPWKENDGFVGTLSKPFPHTTPWNDLTGEPAYDEANEDEYEKQMDFFERNYFNPGMVNGAVPICHLGCSLRQWLVVTGPEAGNIWCDDRVDHKGLYPLQQVDAKRVSFIRWYRAWLDEALSRLEDK